MIAEIVLSIFAVAFLAYHLASSSRPAYLSLAVWAITVLALLTIWIPDFSTTLAHWMGIGRGADMIIYLWMAVSLLLFLFVRISLFRLEEKLTQLTRRIALASPLSPDKSASTLKLL
ncbi:MAG: DUF2304 domain-containing protein [Proteobacteria bacterium]|nr:DUF2304 domain-containing protein [Pseudomonadota bacterium]